MNRGLAVLICAVVFLAFFATMTEAKSSKPEYTLRFQTAWPSAFKLNELAKHLGNQIEMQSGNRIKVEFYTGGQIVPGMEVWDATSMGIIDAAHVCSCYTVGKNLALGFFCNGTSMPPPVLKAEWMYNGGGLEVAQKLFDQYYKVKVLPSCIISEVWAYSNSEINSLDDLKNLKFRASGIRAATLKNLGCSVLTLPGGEIVPAMEKGVIDAFEYSSLGYDQSLKFDEVAKYVYYSHIVDGGTPFIIINQKWWNKLPDDLKKAVQKASYDTTMWSFGTVSLLELEAMENSERENHTQMRWLPADIENALIKSAKEVIAKQRETNPDMQALMDSLDAFMGKYGKYQEFKSNMY
jgi:TRAP-type mannitol/chloroaromatic compound transport system substrate-binding protein